MKQEAKDKSFTIPICQKPNLWISELKRTDSVYTEVWYTNTTTIYPLCMKLPSFKDFL